jgi:uncharacterized membrane protein YebE (DUF533 family)
VVGSSTPLAEEGGTGACHDDGEAGKAAAALLGARGGRQSTGRPDRAEKVAASRSCARLGYWAKRLFQAKMREKEQRAEE